MSLVSHARVASQVLQAHVVSASAQRVVCAGGQGHTTRPHRVQRLRRFARIGDLEKILHNELKHENMCCQLTEA
jgi:hypothetical protein